MSAPQHLHGLCYTFMSAHDFTKIVWDGSEITAYEHDTPFGKREFQSGSVIKNAFEMLETACQHVAPFSLDTKMYSVSEIGAIVKRYFIAELRLRGQAHVWFAPIVPHMPAWIAGKMFLKYIARGNPSVQEFDLLIEHNKFVARRQQITHGISLEETENLWRSTRRLIYGQ